MNLLLTVHDLYKFDHNAEVQFLASSSQTVFGNSQQFQVYLPFVGSVVFCDLMGFGSINSSLAAAPTLVGSVGWGASEKLTDLKNPSHYKRPHKQSK